jgi:hypothetical protein
MTQAFRAFAALLPQIGPVRKVVAPGPNDQAIVIWIKIGTVNVLLGADLEAGGNPNVGWKAILASHTRPVAQARIFKVPHHGSADADEPDVWRVLLVPDPIAALTPYSRGATPLPRSSDIARLKSRTPTAYLTAKTGGWSPPRRDSAVERMLKETAVAHRAVSGPMGHVRIRGKSTATSAPAVQLFNGAMLL